MIDQLLDVQCRNFGIEGLAFSEELQDGNSSIFNNYNGRADLFTISLAIALGWTKHAKYDNSFFDFAIDFFLGEDEPNSNLISKYSLRFGDQALLDAMKGLRNYKNKIKMIVPDFTTCDAKAMEMFQNKSLESLLRLKKKHEVTGVGPWLFLGPFKIILGTLDRFWNDPNIDSIILPSGDEVRRGIKKLIKQQSLLVKEFDIHWLENEEGSLSEGYCIDKLIHNVFCKIAQRGNSRALHINSAFYLFGRE